MGGASLIHRCGSNLIAAAMVVPKNDAAPQRVEFLSSHESFVESLARGCLKRTRGL